MNRGLKRTLHRPLLVHGGGCAHRFALWVLSAAAIALTAGPAQAAPGGFSARPLADMDRGPASSMPRVFARVGTRIVLAASVGDRDSELWRARRGGVAGEPLTRDLTPTPIPLEPVGLGDQVFYRTTSRGDYGSITGILRTDGTPTGTFEVAGLCAPNEPCFITGVKRLGGNLLVSVENTGVYRIDLNSPRRAELLIPDVELALDEAARKQGRLYAPGAVSETGFFEWNAWTTDGTPGGTREIATIGDDGTATPSRDYTIWAGDLYLLGEGPNGHDALVRLEADGEPSPPRILLGGTGRVLRELTATRDKLLLVDGIRFSELWRSDGTVSGTELVETPTNTEFEQLVRFDGGVVMSGADLTYGNEIWRTDGTDSGTRPIIDLAPGRQGASIDEVTASADHVFFTAFKRDSGREVWATDGTQAGTVEIEIAPGGDDAAPGNLARLGKGVVLSATDGVHGLEPWLIR